MVEFYVLHDESSKYTKKEQEVEGEREECGLQE